MTWAAFGSSVFAYCALNEARHNSNINDQNNHVYLWPNSHV